MSNEIVSGVDPASTPVEEKSPAPEPQPPPPAADKPKEAAPEAPDPYHRATAPAKNMPKKE